MRKLATIREIDAIDPIPGADSIEVATVGGWKVVVKTGEFVPGDLAVYFEIDSWIPTHIAPFLSKGREPSEYEGIKGERLRTVKLRGQVSQGLLIHMGVLRTESGDHIPWKNEHKIDGADVTELLGIQKYEPPIPACLGGEAVGYFPSYIRKTDQERIQNLTAELNQWIAEYVDWEVTEKLDGSSCTIFINNGETGVCSRNLQLKENDDNSFWKAAKHQGIIGVLNGSNVGGRNIAIQGELIGEGIQKNPYNIKGQKFFVFDIFDIDKHEYFTPDQRQMFCKENGLAHVPTINESAGLTSVEELLKIAEGKSKLNDKTEREGLVYKSRDGQKSFKCISNRFLIKTN